MPLSPELRAAYEAADYVVFGKPELVFHVGEKNAVLDAMMEVNRAKSAAFVTAENPRGRLTRKQRRGIALLEFVAALGDMPYKTYDGEGRDPKGLWQAEVSALIVGISRARAEAMGRRLRQNAIVWIEKGKAPELVVLA